MRCLAGSDWGASRSSLRNIYMAIIRSAIDYGSMIYGSASKSLLKKVDAVQTQALRICCGAFKTSPRASMQVEMGEMPLEIRRKQLKMVYWASLMGHNNEHPTKAILLKSWENGKSNIKNIGQEMEEIAESIEVKNIKFSNTVHMSAVPPWMFVMPIVDLYLTDEVKKQDCDPIKIRVNKYMDQKYYDMIQIFTDGSKDPETMKTGIAVVIPHYEIVIKKRTPDFLSVFTAELVAI